MKLYLLRHSKTFGNTLGRYIGRTDEPLCEEGIALLQEKSYPKIREVYVSPLKRCTQTAKILYPEAALHLVEKLAECDFGDFENKNYQELDGNPDYQRWVDSGGTLPFPGGESQEAFRNRCVDGFLFVVEDMIQKKREAAAVVAHGGTIMAVLDRFAVPHKDFYYWQAKNAEGFEIEIDQNRWMKGMREVTVCGKVTVPAADGKKTV